MKTVDERRPLGRDDLLTREMDGEFFLYDPVTDQIAMINASAAIVFDLCDGTRTAKEISDEVERIYGAESSQVAEDVRAALADFEKNSLLARCPAPPAPESGQ